MRFGLHEWTFKNLEWCMKNEKDCFCYRELPKELKIWKDFLDAINKRRIIIIET